MRCLILGNAKTGTTALFYAIAKSMPGAHHYFEEQCSSLAILPPDTIAKVIFERENDEALDKFLALFDKRVVIVRDPRDNLVSRALYSVAIPHIVEDELLLRRFVDAVRRKEACPDAVNFTDILAMVCHREGGIEPYIEKRLMHYRRLNDFAAHAGRDCLVVQYEDFVEGNMTALEAYLGVRIDPDFSVDAAYLRVRRTCSHGDWKHWFTDDDVALLRPIFNRLSGRDACLDDWRAAQEPCIDPEHGSAYLLRVIAERRHTFGLPAFGEQIHEKE